jgi:hypothetical protein
MSVPSDADPRRFVIRYLGAFGPASISDIRVWSRLNGLREVVDGMRSELSVHTAEDGTALLDLPDGAILDEDVPAPPRFLPEYDNVLLGHADRSRFFVEGVIPPGWAGNLLVDGLFSGWWKVHKGKEAHLEVRLLRKVGRAGINAVRVEAERLVELAHPEAIARSIDLQEDH